MITDTKSQKPPMRSSDEANQEQLALARAQGEAMQKALEHMTKKEAHGAEKPAGDYLVGYAVEEAEGMYHFRDGQLQWHDPEDENLHFVPYLTVYATLWDSTGSKVGTYQQPFIWHPWLYHYGRNWRVLGDGEYRLRVRIEAPDFHRHDKINGKRFVEPVEVEFKSVQTIQTGGKGSCSGRWEAWPACSL